MENNQGQAWYSTNNGVNWKQFSIASTTNIFYSLAANQNTGLIAGDEDVQLGTTRDDVDPANRSWR